MHSLIKKGALVFAALISFGWAPAFFLRLFTVKYTFLGFLASPEYQSREMLVFLLACAAYLGLFYFNKDCAQRFLSARVGEKISIVLGVLMFSWLAAWNGFPATFYWFSSETRTVFTTVSDIDLSPGRRSPCKAELSVAYDTGIFSKICVSDSTARALKKGEAVEVSGWWHPWFGLYVKEVSKVP
jgi:hypothetical protein